MPEHTRTLGFKVAFAIGLGTMIAAGIFSLSGTAVARIGSSAVIAFVIAAAVAGITAASYSEFASIYSENGGGYLFSVRTFDSRFLEYAVGAMLFVGYTGTTAFYLATMDEWFVRFLIPHGWPTPHGTVGVAAAVLLGALNARGTEESGTFQLLVTGAKVAVLLAFVGGAFAYKAPAATVGTFAAEFTTAPVPILSIAALAFITFFGFSAIAASAGEIVRPRETVPKAIAASILTVTVLYTLVIVAMVNSPVPAAVIAEQGETAMGRVASAFLGPVGRSLIVAGAVFSMVSASNASILAASGIGSLMGRQGQAPRRLSRLHPDYGTPFWSVVAATATIVAAIAVFVGVFPDEGGLAGIDLGLPALTGYATLNLLLPLSLVNGALIVSRRKYPDLDRPLAVPFVPAVPVVGVLANLALVTNLPLAGVVVGALVTGALLVAYYAWGGAPEVEELFQRTVPPSEPTAARTGASGGPAVGPGAEADGAAEPGVEEAAAEPGAPGAADRFRVLVPVNRIDRAPAYVRLAAILGGLRGDDPVVQVVNITRVPEQTPYEMLTDVADGRASAIAGAIAEADLDVDYTVEGHTCRDVGFDVVHTAREDGADLVVMGFPERHHEVAETVEYDAPCDVVFAEGVTATTSLDAITVGVGGGPHHRAFLPLLDGFVDRGAAVHLVEVVPRGAGGTPEDPDVTLSALGRADAVEFERRAAATVADGLVGAAADHGGVLVVGASRTRRLRRWLFGGTPDRVIERAREADVPVLVYASETDVRGWAEDRLFPVYRFLRRFAHRRRTAGSDAARTRE